MGLFKDAFAFPFRNLKRIWWFWIMAIPVVGWIWFLGYVADINKRNAEDELKELPKMGEFWPVFKIGFFYLLLSAILGLINNFLLYIPRVGWIPWIIGLFLIPILLVHYSVTREFKQGFNLKIAFELLIGHFWKYLGYNLCLLVLIVVLFICSLPIITALLTIPAMSFSSIYLYSRFYREVYGRRHRKH